MTSRTPQAAAHNNLQGTQYSTPINVYGRAADVEAQIHEGTPPSHHQAANNGGQPPTPRSIFSPQRSATVRHADSAAARRRIRQRSINLPYPDNLEEDLGHPPICTPPPEITASASDSPFRLRSGSDAFRSFDLSSHSSSRRNSGFLLVFPPSAHTPTHSHPLTRFNSAKESHSAGGIGDVRLPNLTTGSRSLEGAFPPPPTPAEGAAMASPLFVDTHLANSNRTQLRGALSCPLKGVARCRTFSLNTPNLFKRSENNAGDVTSRQSQSEEHPGNVISPRTANFYARTAMRSFDSGLGLSSPSIGQTALLIKESALLNSSFDAMTLTPNGVADINTIFCDSQDAVYSLFMKAHKCYDLIPTSTKLVVFDTHLPVRKAFYALVFNGVRAAPLWDSNKRQFIGMLTITDFIKILIRHYEAGDTEERMRALEEEEICHWRAQFELDGNLRPLVSIDPSESLYRAVQVLCESKVHRLPVLDRQTGNISYILTHKRIIKFLSLYINDLPRPAYMDQTPRELGIGSWGDVLSIHIDTPLHDALDIFLKNRVSALPLVDEQGRVVDIYAKFDVISLAAEKSYDKLDCTVQEALKHRSEWFEGVQCCQETDSLYGVLEAIVKAEVHRLIVTDSDKKVTGIISLSDILKYLILDPVLPDVASAPAALSSSATNRTLSSSTMEGGDSPLLMDVPEAMED